MAAIYIFMNVLYFLCETQFEIPESVVEMHIHEFAFRRDVSIGCGFVTIAMTQPSVFVASATFKI